MTGSVPTGICLSLLTNCLFPWWLLDQYSRILQFRNSQTPKNFCKIMILPSTKSLCCFSISIWVLKWRSNGDAFYRILQIHKKKSSCKMLPQWEFNPGPLMFMPCILLSELIPYLLEVSRPLDPYIVMFYWFQKFLRPRINRACLHKDLKVWNCQTTGGNILLLDFFVFFHDSLESTEYISI